MRVTQCRGTRVAVRNDLLRKEDNSMTERENLQTVKDTLAGLPPEERRSILTEVVKTQLSDEHQKDVATETAKALPDELQKDVATETAKTLPDELQKDVAAETTQTLLSGDKKGVVVEAAQTLSNETQRDVAAETARVLPDQLTKDIVAEAAKALPHEVKKDVVANTVRDMPKEDKKDIASTALENLTRKEREDIVGNPTQRVTDQIWLTIVRTFAVVLFVSAMGLLYVSIWPPEGETNPTQVMLPVFTSIAGILAGFIGGRASAGPPA